MSRTNSFSRVLVMLALVLFGCGSREERASRREPAPVTPQPVAPVAPPRPAVVAGPMLVGVAGPGERLRTLLADGDGLWACGDAIHVPFEGGYRVVDTASAVTNRRFRDLQRWQRGERRPPRPRTQLDVVREDPAAMDALPDGILGEWEERREVSLLFVGRSHVGLERIDAGYTGGAHPFAYRGLAMLPITRGDAVPIEDVLGLPAAEALEREGARVRTEELAAPSRTNWALVRRRGGWVVRGGLGYASEVLRGAYRYFDVEVDVPASVSGGGDASDAFETLAAAVRGVRDAARAHDGAATLLVLADRLEWKLGEQSLGVVPCRGCSLVMTLDLDAGAATRHRTELGCTAIPPRAD